MSALARRLASLQRQAGGRPSVAATAAPSADIATTASAPAAARIASRSGSEFESAARTHRVPAPDAALPALRPASASIDQLRRLLGLRARLAVVPAPSPPRREDRDLPGDEIAPGLRLHQQRLPWPVLPDAQLDLTPLERLPVRREQLCFFDTETTGLAGGTGTRAFQIGVGDWHEGSFRVRQLTLTTLSGEAAMLDEFARWLEDERVLVSYNGRSYDAPLLATRYRLARRASPLAALPHLDLLHPVRRRYRGRWANCRLATVERELLGIVREDDLPGSEAPRAWLDYLRGGSAHDLRRVGEHNRQDLCSLAGLLLRLVGAPGGVDASADPEC
jgi:uncharacterized protein YprB with RNaseH-like and TPR domain